jgi:2-aminobenzoate-CoA ligase
MRTGSPVAPSPELLAERLAPSGHVDAFTRDNLPPLSEWPLMLFDLPGLRISGRLNCTEELLDGTIARFGGDRPCLYDGEGWVWSYSELREHADRIAKVLVEDFGIVPGNRVLLRGPNTRWLVACWFGVLRAGAVAVTTMPLLRAGELSQIVESAAVDLALCDVRYVDELYRGAGNASRIVTYSDAAGTDNELGRRAAAKSGSFIVRPTSADDVALIAFTSGTSGRPKATMHFHRDVLAIADTFAAHVLRPRPDDVFIGSPPLAFTFGLGGLVVFPMRVGASSVLLERSSPAELFTAVDQRRASVLFTAPTAYRAALRDIERYRLASLRRCVSAGEALSAHTRAEFRAATGQQIIDGIGATEMLHIFIAAADGAIRPGAIGRPVPGFRAQVVDDAGWPVDAGVPGQLAVRGPTGCRYLADDRQREYVQHAWNLTGDTFIRDDDGYFWFQARSDDMIMTSGYNVAAPEVEEALLRHPLVAACGVIGVPDPDRGEIVKALVLLREGVEATERQARELQDFAKSQIAPYKYPRLVEFVSDLPFTSTGKLRRNVLRERRST